VPQLLHVNRSQDNDATLALKFIIMTKLPGQVLINVYGRSSADVMLKISTLEVPQKIGSLVAGLIDNTLDVMPIITQSPRIESSTTQEYFVFLFSLKRRSPPIGNDTESKQRARTILSALQSHIHSRLQTIHPHLLRCIIVRDDPNYSNILLDGSGNITGVIDWEFHSLQPMIFKVGGRISILARLYCM
jgi:serine/threonine protein kinase